MILSAPYKLYAVCMVMVGGGGCLLEDRHSEQNDRPPILFCHCPLSVYVIVGFTAPYFIPLTDQAQNVHSAVMSLNCYFVAWSEKDIIVVDPSRYRFSVKWGFHEPTKPADERHKTAD